MPGKDEIERRCALTHEVKPAADLIRFVVGPDGVLVPDTDAKAEGRGVWISLGEHQVAEAVRKKAFAKSLKEAVTVPADLHESSTSSSTSSVSGRPAVAARSSSSTMS